MKGEMQNLVDAVRALLGGVLRLALWALMAVLALFLLGLAMLLLAVGVLWALIRGRRPEPPVFVAQFRQFAAGRVWPGARPSANGRDVVDVEVREVSADQRLEDPRDDSVNGRRP